MSLNSGGHLNPWMQNLHNPANGLMLLLTTIEVDKDSGLIDYDQALEKLALD